MRVIKFIFVVMLLSVSSMALIAQDETDTGDCEINLTSAASLIVQAQAEASSGQREDALRSIALVQSVLADAVERCGGEAGEMPDVVLGGDFRSPNGAFSFDYPADWSTQVVDTFEDGGIVYVGTNTATLRALTQVNPVLISGQQGVAVLVGPADEVNNSLDDDATLDEVLREFVDQLQDDGETTAGEITRFSVNDFQAGAFDFSATGFEGILLIIDRSDIGVYGLALGAAAPGEIEAIRPIVMALAESIAYGE
ncbi:MAG: hypothetical protein RLP44_16080 [Aggregatilineales bacterium]